VASSLAGVLAQRLVRTICSRCKESYEPSSLERSYFSVPPEVLWRGAGCERCNHTGYLGRIGIFELLLVDSGLTHMITEKTDSQSIKGHAISRGMKTLRSDGLDKVRAGVTTLEELLRVTQKDDADI
jgi:general secretion pathway protein E